MGSGRTKLTREEILELGFPTKVYEIREFKKQLKENKRMILFNDERFKKFYFFDNVDKIMYKTSWDDWNRVSHKIIKEYHFLRREFRKKDYDLYFYRIYGCAVEFYKTDKTMKYNLEYQFQKIVSVNDKLIAKKLHA